MTILKKPYQAYAAAMQTMAGTRQVVMLYEGIIRYLQQAREAMAQRRIEERYNNLTRASEIVFGLQSCLDFERGGDVAKVLYNFYTSLDARIFSLHRSGDAAVCEQLIADVKRMRDVWAEIDSSGGAKPPVGTPAALGTTADQPGMLPKSTDADPASGIAISA